MKTKHLGKTKTKQQTGFKILDPIARIKASKSYGIDYWNAYEFSYLDSNKNPVLKVLEIKIPSSSIYIVESKSLKVYLNSFYKKIFIHEKDVLIKIEKDLNRLTKSSTSLRFVKKFPSEPNSLKLNTSLRQFSKPNHPIRFDGFRSICPVTSQPDFAIIYIYTNAKIDLKWLKIFLRSFKEKGEFHEQCIEDIFVSIEKKYPDFCIEVCGRFLRRGGIDINPIRSSKKTFHFKNFRVFNQ